MTMVIVAKMTKSTIAIWSKLMGEHCGDEASSDLYKAAQKNMMMMTKKQDIDEDNSTDDQRGKLMADHCGDVNPSDLCKPHTCAGLPGWAGDEVGRNNDDDDYASDCNTVCGY